MLTRRKLLACGSLIALAAAVRWSPLQAAETKGLPVMLYKTPGCECCSGYADYLRSHGFTVTVKETEKLAAISGNAGIPAELQGCHTSFVGGYVIEGHVPIEAVQKLLAERPAIKGIALANMPPGSPGMPGPKQGPFVIHAIDKEGKSSIYMTI
ncbi:MAG: DUF411 domain-containing protein [Rhizobiaceae bacterium]